MLTSIRFALSPHHHHQYQYQSKLFFLTLSNRKAFPDVVYLAQFAPLRSPPPLPRRSILRSQAWIRTPFALAMASGESSRVEYANRLAQEKSPYLLQHAHNPVNWYPWGEEAFLKAKEEDKPIFLSVGYSTCHWCHVMEVESFENEEVAKLLNDSFVSIKVDREERPDVDKVYMTYVQATQGGGGWPMSVFLTPELKPFLGGTYFPPEDKYGRSGFKSILRRVKEVWDVKKDSIRLSGEQVIQQLGEATAASAHSTEIIEGLAEKAIELCAEELMDRYDEEYGGFGSAPKFPRPVEINLMFWHYKRLKLGGKEDMASKALAMALHTLRSMGRGGVHDHVGGGFHRYSVDEYWHVPHFEKMLYDQGQLVSVYLDAFAISKEVIFACVARDVMDYLMREMLHAEGGIFSAEDADSADMEGSAKKEGAFYVWSSQEIADVLGKDKSELFMWHYYVKPRGNCDLSSLSDPHNEFFGKNVLMELKGLEKTVSKFGIPRDEVLKILGLCRRELFETRVKRPHPHLDDKVIVAWNGLAISAFAKASRILKTGPCQPAFHFPVTGCDASEYFGVAERAANFVKSQIYDERSRRLQRSFREGPSQAPGFLDDYAYLIAGLLDLYEAGGNTKWLSWACELQEIQDNLFLDPVGGGYFSTPEGDPSILIRMKDDYDGAEPSGNSVAAMNLLRLSSLVSGDQSNDYHRIAEHLLAVFEERVKNLPLAVPLLCCAMGLIAQPEKRQVVVAGLKQTPEFAALLTSCHASFDPSKVIIHVDPSDPEDVKFWELRNPMVLAMAQKSSGSEAVAYVCQNFTCQAPIRDPLALQQLLEQPPSSPKVTTFNIKSVVKP